MPYLLSANYSAHSAGRRRHYHDYHQIIFVTGGKASVFIEEKPYSVSAGCILLIARYERHQVQSLSGEYQRYTLELASPENDSRPSERTRLLSVFTDRPEHFSSLLTVSNPEEIGRLFARILKEWQGNAPLREEMLSVLLEELCLQIIRDNPTISPRENKSSALVDNICREFEQHCERPFSLKELAERYHLSPSGLSHLFRRISGISIMNYLKASRLARARQLLAESDLRIGEIQESCGFSDASNFSRLFRSETGMSPREYRTEKQGQKQK